MFLVARRNPQPLSLSDGSDSYRVFVRHWRLENSLFTIQNSPAKCQYPMNIVYSDVEPLENYSPAILHLSPATILEFLVKTL